MDTASEEIIKIEVEEYEQNIEDWIQIDYGAASEVVEEDAGVQDNDMEIVEIEPHQSNADWMPLGQYFKCTIRKCTWYTEEEDTNMKYIVMKNHFDEHHKNKSNICSICFCAFKTQRGLTLHTENVHCSFQCPHCGQHFESMPQVVSHFQALHEVTSCSIKDCEWFTEEQDKNVILSLLTTHAKDDHNVTNVCQFCLKVFIARASYLRHMRANHRPIGSMPEVGSQDQTIRITSCSMNGCDWSTEEQDRNVILSLVKTHAKVVHKLNNFCKYCFRLYKARASCLAHMRTGHALRKCRYCELLLEPNLELAQHMKEKHAEESLTQNGHQFAKAKTTPVVEHSISCPICNCKFFNHDQLRPHLVKFHFVSTDIDMGNVTFPEALVKKMKCNLCPNLYTQVSSIRRHYSEIHQVKIPRLAVRYKKKGIYTCYLCRNPTFIQLDSMKDHFSSAHNQNFDIHDFDFSKWYTASVMALSSEEGKLIFTCRVCQEFYSTSDDLKTHTTQVHHKYVCSKCNLMVDSSREEKLHYDQVHTGSCRICAFKSHTSVGILSHMLKKHKHIQIIDEYLIYKKPIPSNDAFHTCKLCRKSLNSLQNTKMHYYWFHNQYVCTACNLVFKTVSMEAEHLIKCYQADLMCEICGEYVINGTELVEHREKHGENVNGFSTELEMELQSNMMENITDSTEQESGTSVSELPREKKQRKKPLKLEDHFTGDFCKLCNINCSDISAHLLSVHQINNVCSICNREFHESDVMRKHLKYHPQYKCNECSMQFHFMKNLEKHVNELHTNYYAFYCSNCNSVSSTAREFNLHTKLQGCTTEAEMLPALRCDMCQQLCLSRRTMREHMKSVHVLFGHILNVKRRTITDLPLYMYTVYGK